MGRLLTLNYAIEITTEISNAMNGPDVVGRCYLSLGHRCSDSMPTYDRIRDGCAPCRANALAALLVDALEQVRKEKA